MLGGLTFCAATSSDPAGFLPLSWQRKRQCEKKIDERPGTVHWGRGGRPWKVVLKPGCSTCAGRLGVAKPEALNSERSMGRRRAVGNGGLEVGSQLADVGMIMYGNRLVRVAQVAWLPRTQGQKSGATGPRRRLPVRRDGSRPQIGDNQQHLAHPISANVEWNGKRDKPKENDHPKQVLRPEKGTKRAKDPTT